MQTPQYTLQSTTGFPQIRLRRNRTQQWLRDIVAETQLTPHDFVQVMFIRDAAAPADIPSMPGVRRYALDEITDAVGRAAEQKIPAIALFPYIEKKDRDENVLQMLTPENTYCQAVRKIKQAFPQVGLIVDVALDTYAVHGQDGVVADGKILNDVTLDVISDYALTLAEAGADVIAPSEMMDGRVGVIRQKLDQAGYTDTAILAYAAKYASNYYGPYRDAVGSKECLAQADKNTYQMDPRNSEEALRETALDISEGADMVMVKPAMLYLDIIQKVKQNFQMPTFAFQISGEYAMLKAAAQNGWLDYDKCMREALTSIKRAGADAILTYAGIETAKALKEGW